MEKEKYDIKYISELQEYWNDYNYALINEIYVGVAINLGMDPKDAYNLAKVNPNQLQKSFFKNTFNKFKNVFNHKVKKFRYDRPIFKGDGTPLTLNQWERFNKYISDFWTTHANPVAEDMTIKAHELGKQTTRFRQEKKDYDKMSLEHINEKQYKGDMPSGLIQAYSEYDFDNAEKKALNNQYSNVAMYVNQTDSTIQDAIRQQIITGIDNNKSPVEVASDLFWNVEKNENFVNKYTAQAMRRDWNRISSTEMASIYEAGILAPYESQAMESIKDPTKAQYFVFTGGSCQWCQAHQGSLTRLVPMDVVTSTANDSLKSMGIKDEHTDTALWIGKNNVGYKENKSVQEWRVTTPAHVHNVATMQPIDLDKEYYNDKTDKVERKLKKDKFIPTQVDYSQKSKEEKEWREPTNIGGGLVRKDGNIYEAVDSSIYNKKMDEWRENPSLPIPVNSANKNDMLIFKDAK